MAESLKKKAVHGVLWSGAENFSVQGIQFVVMIVMANLLDPSDYGILGMLAIFIAVSNSFVNSGFSQALIRKIDRTETDCSTVFYFNLAIAALFYLLLFFSAPLIARFYSTPLLVPVTRVISLSLIINAFTIVQRALFTARVDFRSQTIASIAAVVLSGTTGIWLAYKGYGVWALVAQTLILGAVNSLLLWILSRWHPRSVFSFESLRSMFSFGSKLLLSGLIDTIYNNVYTLVIGRKFSAADLGFYTRANNFAQFPSTNLTNVLQRVTYPVLCNIQNDPERLATAYRKLLRLSGYVIFPLMIGLAAVARPTILILIGQKWEPSILLLQILCFALMWYPIHAINLNLLQVTGRSDLFLRLEIIKKAVGIVILCITIPMGLTAMVAGLVVHSVLSLLINTHYTGKQIGVGFWRQMGDLFPVLCSSLLSGAAAWLAVQLLPTLLTQLIGGIAAGVICYLGLSLLFRSPELKELLGLIKNR